MYNITVLATTAGQVTIVEMVITLFDQSIKTSIQASDS